MFLKRIKEILKKAIYLEKKINENMLKAIYEKKILNEDIGNQLIYKQNEKNIIVSLTSYSKRVLNVHLVIESIFNQTLKPNKIILWLSESEFNIDDIPLILKKMKKKGLEIRFCKDLKSYKKLVPTIKEYPNDTIITIDDDIFYPYNFIENFYTEHKRYPKLILYNRGHKIIFKKNGKVEKYNKWIHDYQNSQVSFATLPTGVGGVLYPSNSLDLEVLNEKSFMKLAPRADDVWFKAMALKNKTKSKRLRNSSSIQNQFIEITSGNDIALSLTNTGKISENDIQIKKVFDKYNLWKLLKDE